MLLGAVSGSGPRGCDRAGEAAAAGCVRRDADRSPGSAADQDHRVAANRIPRRSLRRREVRAYPARRPIGSELAAARRFLARMVRPPGLARGTALPRGSGYLGGVRPLLRRAGGTGVANPDAGHRRGATAARSGALHRGQVRVLLRAADGDLPPGPGLRRIAVHPRIRAGGRGCLYPQHAGPVAGRPDTGAAGPPRRPAGRRPASLRVRSHAHLPAGSGGHRRRAGPRQRRRRPGSRA